MLKTIVAAASTMILLGACQTMTGEMMEDEAPTGVSATDCFAAGGMIDSTGDASMCKMQDGSAKPIL